MKRLVASMLVLDVLLAVVVCGCTAKVNPEQTKAIAEIERLGGKVTIDKGSPDKSVIEVNLSNTHVTDAGLEHLKALTQLQELNLFSTKVTDAGLEHLKGLTQLTMLVLFTPKVTDAGVRTLRQALPNCEILH